MTCGIIWPRPFSHISGDCRGDQSGTSPALRGSLVPWPSSRQAARSSAADSRSQSRPWRPPGRRVPLAEWAATGQCRCRKAFQIIRAHCGLTFIRCRFPRPSGSGIPYAPPSDSQQAPAFRPGMGRSPLCPGPKRWPPARGPPRHSANDVADKLIRRT